MDDIGKIVHKPYGRKLERVYWIGVIVTEDWNKDNFILDLSHNVLTGEILISKPVYHHKYERKVRYVSMSFFKTVTSSYLGTGFVLDNDIVPVIQSTPWIRGKQWQFCSLIRSLGKPDFEYSAGEFKSAYNYKRKRRT